MHTHRAAVIAAILVATASAVRAQTLAASVDPHRPLVLTHVRVIDGTGHPGKDDQTIVIGDGRIRGVGRTGTVALPPEAVTLDMSGRTVLPGLVGMHEH